MPGLIVDLTKRAGELVTMLEKKVEDTTPIRCLKMDLTDASVQIHEIKAEDKALAAVLGVEGRLEAEVTQDAFK